MNYEKLFPNVDKKKLEAAITSAKKSVRPEKVEKFETASGGYNGLPLPAVAGRIVSVTDAGKGKLTYRLIGQTVVADRNFVGPVVVEYVTPAEVGRYELELHRAIESEVRK